MTPKQKRFCDEYIIDHNATQAAIRAGYSPKTAKQQGQRMLTFVDLQKYIEEKEKAIENKNIASAEEVREFLTGVMRDGEETEMRDKLKAAELLGKCLGIFKEKLDINVEPVTIVDDLRE